MTVNEILGILNRDDIGGALEVKVRNLSTDALSDIGSLTLTIDKGGDTTDVWLDINPD